MICKSPTHERVADFSEIDLVQILRYTHGLMFILLLPAGPPDHHCKYPPAKHVAGLPHTRVKNYGSGSQLTKMHRQFQSCRTT